MEIFLINGLEVEAKRVKEEYGKYYITKDGKVISVRNKKPIIRKTQKYNKSNIDYVLFQNKGKKTAVAIKNLLYETYIGEFDKKVNKVCLKDNIKPLNLDNIMLTDLNRKSYTTDLFIYENKATRIATFQKWCSRNGKNFRDYNKVFIEIDRFGAKKFSFFEKVERPLKQKTDLEIVEEAIKDIEYQIINGIFQ